MEAIALRNMKKKEEEEEYDGEMGIFYNPSKIMKLVLFILIINGTSKQHKRMAQKVFLSKFERIRQILKHALCAFY